MKIKSAHLYRQVQPFSDGPYICRGQAEEGFDSCIVALEAEDGTVGWGEAAPLGAFYAEAFPEAMRAGIERLLPVTIGLSATAPARLADALNHAMLGQPSVKSAIDMAAWDLAARIMGCPLSDLLGGADGTSVPLYRSIGQTDPDAMARKAQDYVKRGYRRLQVKVGADPLEDVARMQAVRAAVPDDVPLYADANGGWLLEDALRFVDRTRDLDYWLEQPCMGYADNRTIARRCAKPMVLDEGLVTLEDLLHAHQDGVISGATLKIARIGGIGPTRLIRDVAVSLGLKVTIEDTGGSTINTAATAHMMLSTPTAQRAHTVDFMNWVTVQNATGMPETADGKLFGPSGSGLGICVDPDIFTD
ncbi:MAG: mandelate racemase/muconate lactonizing enzyme family protein [Alphaproteobacteria bacterium]|nr:mandelate racemase/muconate lactonizing enzyme family protein [Alphaproteobacteria bacterium]